MPSDHVAISARNLTKSYRLFNHPGDRIKQFFSFGLKHYYQEFNAFENVSFNIRKGETVGVIGRNGSGKSTLLQLICGILKPTSGKVVVNGRISALLELGAGFNPEFTGQENIYFQGSLLGFSSAAMDERYDDIVGFAEIGEFIDHPVRLYSSGMFVRLAFAVAVHLEPEILLIDEALAVGDSAFQVKCLRFLRAFREDGGTLIVVSHDTRTIKALCDSAIWLEANGRYRVGPVDEVLDAYLLEQHSEARTRDEASASALIGQFMDVDYLARLNANFASRAEESRQGTGEARIESAVLLNDAGLPLVDVEFGQRVKVRLRIRYHTVCSIIASYYLCETSDELLIGSSTLLENLVLLRGESGDVKTVDFVTELPLAEGVYSIRLQLSMPIVPNISSEIVDAVHDALFFRMRSRRPVRVWSKVYLKNEIAVRG